MTRNIMAALLVAIPAWSQAPAKSVPQRIADDFIALAGGVHPGYRIAHAKGIVVTGTFTPSPGATALSRAPHLVAASTPVIVRYSNASGIPTIADNDPTSQIRGLAIRFNLPNGTFTDIVANTRNGFAVGTGEDFAAFLDAIVAQSPTASTRRRSKHSSAHI